MSTLFHENVSNDFIEYFIIDLHKNYESLVDLAQHHVNADAELKNTIEECVDVIMEIIEEENKMLKALADFRPITNAEDKVIRAALALKKTSEIGYLVDNIIFR